MDITKLDILKTKANLISAKELCEQLNICESTLWYYRQQGMPYIKIGGRVYFDMEEVAEFLVKNNSIQHSNTPMLGQGDLNGN